ncbi:hypothetical protein PALA111701_10020 [Paenibacillus lactis]
MHAFLVTRTTYKNSLHSAGMITDKRKPFFSRLGLMPGLGSLINRLQFCRNYNQQREQPLTDYGSADKLLPSLLAVYAFAGT